MEENKRDELIETLQDVKEKLESCILDLEDGKELDEIQKSFLKQAFSKAAEIKF